MPGPDLRLAEPLAALSVATDLARGQPAEQALYATVIATRVAGYLGLSPADRASTYYATLLRFAGCTATSHEYAQHFGGNDIAVRFGGDAIDPADPAQLGGLLAALGAADADPGAVMQVVAEGSRADCEVGARMATRLGLGADVSQSLLYIFERWDGHGLPNGVPGPEIPLVARIGHVATVAAMFAQARGRSAGVTTLTTWSGGILDPEITATFLDHSDELFACLDAPDAWKAVLEVEPSPARMVRESDLDRIYRVLGDFVDLKTPFLLGHSGRVSALAEGAARILGMPEDDCVALRRAGLLHDLGRVGVATGTWEKPGPLSTLELEQARLHPYHTERILDRTASLRPLARLAGQHHERMDGTGYFRGSGAASLDRPSRVLAAADACAELLEDRPGRKALSLDASATQLKGEALDSESLRAVLEAAGIKQAFAVQRPAGLTAREVEVLRLLAVGRTLGQIAEQLVISASTAHTHAAHVYEKAGVSTRAGAALFAMEHGLLA